MAIQLIHAHSYQEKVQNSSKRADREQNKTEEKNAKNSRSAPPGGVPSKNPTRVYFKLDSSPQYPPPVIIFHAINRTGRRSTSDRIERQGIFCCELSYSYIDPLANVFVSVWRCSRNLLVREELLMAGKRAILLYQVVCDLVVYVRFCREAKRTQPPLDDVELQVFEGQEWRELRSKGSISRA
mgnify:FL=1|tara:strand:+ start:489 stop:1037 length:549 start_codon:yes stop_codon:yes gene_type:complete